MRAGRDERLAVAPEAPADRGRSQLAELQILRALAAFMIAVHHVQGDAALVAARAGQSFAASTLLPWTAGVDIFFVISGFIMVYASAELFGRPDAARTFLQRRIIRIVPLYWAATTLFLAVSTVAPGALNSAPPGLAEIVSSYLFFPFRRADGLVMPVYSLGWTLNLEMLFYVLFGLALGLRREAAVLAVTAALALLVLARATLPVPEALSFWGRPIVLEFAAGMALGLLKLNGAALGNTARLGLAAGGLVLLGLDLSRTGTLPEVLAFGVPAAMLVAAAGLARDEFARSALASAMVRLGDASYALYLLHPFAMRAVRIAGLPLLGGVAFAPQVYLVAALAAAVALALLAHLYFERPVTSLLRQRLAGTR